MLKKRHILSSIEQMPLLKTPGISEQHFLVSMTPSFTNYNWTGVASWNYEQCLKKQNSCDFINRWAGSRQEVVHHSLLQESFRKAQLPFHLKALNLIWKFSWRVNKQRSNSSLLEGNFLTHLTGKQANHTNHNRFIFSWGLYSFVYIFLGKDK